MSQVFTTGFGRREVLDYRTGPTPTLVFANRAQKQYHEPHWKKNTGDGDGRFQTGTTGPAAPNLPAAWECCQAAPGHQAQCQQLPIPAASRGSPAPVAVGRPGPC